MGPTKKTKAVLLAASGMQQGVIETLQSGTGHQGLLVPAGAVLPAVTQQERTCGLHLLAWQG